MLTKSMDSSGCGTGFDCAKQKIAKRTAIDNCFIFSHFFIKIYLSLNYKLNAVRKEERTALRMTLKVEFMYGFRLKGLVRVATAALSEFVAITLYYNALQ